MYQFQPASSEDSKKKVIMIAWVITLVLIPVFYLTVTGKATIDEKNQELEQRLGVALEQNTACLGDLRECAGNVESCNSELTSTKDTIAAKESELVATKKELSEIMFNISRYENLLSQANATVQQCEFTLKQVIVNSAKDVCCRPGLEIANFGLMNYRIVCVGEYTINCTSGESDY